MRYVVSFLKAGPSTERRCFKGNEASGVWSAWPLGQACGRGELRLHTRSTPHQKCSSELEYPGIVYDWNSCAGRDTSAKYLDASLAVSTTGCVER